MRLPSRFRKFLMIRAARIMAARVADVAIGGRDNPYLNRWWIIPRNRFLNIYLHEILRSDDDRALHDHPWWSLSICLHGGMCEHLPGGVVRIVHPGDVILRSARAAHRLEIGGARCITVFITGPRIREWGFYCPEASEAPPLKASDKRSDVESRKASPAGGWRHWKEFTSGDGTTTGRGCGE